MEHALSKHIYTDQTNIRSTWWLQQPYCGSQTAKTTSEYSLFPLTSHGLISASSDHRLVWLRVHPGAFDTVFAVLTEASSLVMSGLGNDEESQHELELSDLRGHLNEFELMGPASGKVLCKALSRVTSEDRREVVQVRRNSTD